MPVCEVCGNDYDKSFEIRMDGETHAFDAFECAIQALAPRCTGCGVRIMGHGVQHGDTPYCSAHCARRDGVTGLNDHN